MRSAVKRRPQPHDVRIFVLSLLAGLPAVLATLGLLVAGDYSAKITWALGTVVVVVWLVVCAPSRPPPTSSQRSGKTTSPCAAVARASAIRSGS